jgi:hypothetical protein
MPIVRAMSTKVSRRTVIKIIGVTGAALAAAPLVGKVSALGQTPGLQKTQAPAVETPSQQQSYSEPLVLVVRGDEILGYRGLTKVPMSDASLAGMLHSRFSKGESS